MSRTGHQGRRDANHKEIVAALRQAGASVLDLGGVGKGCPDLLIGFRGRNYLLEVKHKNGVLTNAQVDFCIEWRGQVKVVKSVMEALDCATQS